MPEGSRFQCPACGVPVATLEFPYRRFGEAWAILLEDCGHAVSLELIRDSWGIEIPEPVATEAGR
jgi:hypothetical protein